MNNDGKDDLVIANQVSTGDVTTLLGNGDGNVSRCRPQRAWRLGLCREAIQTSTTTATRTRRSSTRTRRTR